MAATESDNWRIDQAVTEYTALRAGELDMFAGSTAAQGGAIEYCGSEGDEAHWTVAYVRAEDEALLPLAVGPFERVIKNFMRLDRMDTPIWDPRLFPPPVAIIDGDRRHFRAARGRYLVGVVEAERRAVLLAAIGEALAVVHIAGRERTVLFRGGPFSFREIDVDGLLRSRPRLDRPARPPPVVRPSSSLQAHHARIVGRLVVDAGEGPTIGEVLSSCFEDLSRRATSVPRQSEKQKRKGKTMVRPVVRALYRAVLVGCGNFEGMAGEILEQLKVLCPELVISAEVFADVLRLLLATGTCVVEHPSPRIWRICLVGLTDPRSPLHRRLCKETVGLCRLPVHETIPAGSPATTLSPLSLTNSQRPSSTPTASTTEASTAKARSSPRPPPAPPNAEPGPRATGREPGPGIERDMAEPAREAEPDPVAALEAELPPVVGVPAPAAALAMLYLAAKASIQAEALARVTLQVEREELLARLAVAEAERARRATQVRPPVLHGRSVSTPDSNIPTNLRAPGEAAGASRRDRPVRRLPLFVTESCTALPMIGRPGTRPSVAGLPLDSDEGLRVEPARGLPSRSECRLSIRLGEPDLTASFDLTGKNKFARALGPRGPPSTEG